MKNQPAGLLEYFLFPIFLLSFFFTLFLFDLIQRIGSLFGNKGIEKTELWFNKSLLLCLKF